MEKLSPADQESVQKAVEESNSSTEKAIKTFVFIDLETTGLPKYEKYDTKITEMCAIAVQAEHLQEGLLPRVQNKLLFCFNPMKDISPGAAKISGLSNELLQEQTNFSSEVVEVMAKWLETSRKPICLVAHNGNDFDYPILRAEIDKTGVSLPADILCVDSLPAFQFIDQEPRGHEAKKQRRSFNSYKLADVYRRRTSKEPSNAHEAEGDVIMMMETAATYKEQFVAYSVENAIKFSDIAAMRPE